MTTIRDAPHYLRIIFQWLHEWSSTALARSAARYWGVALGSSCQFVGFPSLVRCRGSHIEIGENGRFLSATRSNRHGLNRPVMITTLRPGAQIIVGSGVGMSGTIICAAKLVRIGDRVMFGANTTITDTDSHPIDYRNRNAEHFGRERHLTDTATQVAPVTIQDDVFVGMHSIILKGVTIGKGAVVAAGSTVTKDVAAGMIVGGSPARVLGSVDKLNN